jgi:hypothetical protein
MYTIGGAEIGPITKPAPPGGFLQSRFFASRLLFDNPFQQHSPRCGLAVAVHLGSSGASALSSASVNRLATYVKTCKTLAVIRRAPFRNLCRRCELQRCPAKTTKGFALKNRVFDPSSAIQLVQNSNSKRSNRLARDPMKTAHVKTRGFASEDRA